MKTSKEFFERLQNDEAFAMEIRGKAIKKIDAGEQDYKALWIPLAAEYGYELKEEELDEWYKIATAELSDEELGKASGGATPAATIIFTASLLVSFQVSWVASKDSAKHDCI